MIRIAAVSDLHGILPKIEKCDLLLIAGDIVPLNIQNNHTKGLLWFIDTFTYWINNLPCEKVVMVAGNHDKLLERAPFLAHAIEEKTNYKLVYLLGNTYEYNHYKIYGSPFSHRFGGWSFMESESWLEGYYSNIPKDTDIILSHDTPMLGDLDLLPSSKWNPQPVHAGGKALAEAIKRINPRYVFCGHLHTCKDKYLKINDTELYNVSILDNEYKEVYEPFYIDI